MSRIPRLSFGVAAIFVSALPLFSQGQNTNQNACGTVPVVNIGTYVPVTAIGTSAVSSLAVFASYPVGLTSSSYISSQQMSADMLAIIAAYPTPTDSVAVIVPALASSLLKKYPQMSAVQMNASPTALSGQYTTAIIYAPPPPPAPPTDGSTPAVAQPKL